MSFQLAAARLAAAALGLGALAAAGAVAAVRRGGLAYSTGYQVMVAATLLGLLALGAALAWAFSAFRRNQGEGKVLGRSALLGSLLLLYPPLDTFHDRITAPAFYDVTTDTENPPAFAALLKQRGPAANAPAFDGLREISYQGEQRSIDYVLHKEYPAITKPHAGFLPGAKRPVAARFWRVFETVKAMHWNIVDYNEAEGRIEATDTSFWFGRMSDIVLRVAPAGLGVRTDIRIQSRYDRRDDGAGAANILRFFKALAP